MTQGMTHRQPSVRMAQPICKDDEQYRFAIFPVTMLSVCSAFILLAHIGMQYQYLFKNEVLLKVN